MNLREALSVFDDAAGVAQRAAELIERASVRALDARERFSLCLTGGTSPRQLHDLLATSPFRERLAWPRFDVFFGDERAVPVDAPESNYATAHRTLLARVPVQSDRVHRMQAERTDLEAAANDYALEIRNTIADVAFPTIDVLLLGLGADGHVLSMYPGCPYLHEAHTPVVALRDPPMNPALSRLSLTPPMVYAARMVILLVLGGAKQNALKSLLDDETPVDRIPGRILSRTRGALHILADREATALLQPR